MKEERGYKIKIILNTPTALPRGSRRQLLFILLFPNLTKFTNSSYLSFALSVSFKFLPAFAFFLAVLVYQSVEKSINRTISSE